MDDAVWDDLDILLEEVDVEDLEDLADTLGPSVVSSLIEVMGGPQEVEWEVPTTPADFGKHLDAGFVARDHLVYLSQVIADAVADVERGVSRKLIIEMPPRSGKTYLATMITSAWILAKHPDWPIMLTSHDGSLAVSWGRQIRRWAETGKLGPSVELVRDSMAASEWETSAGGIVLSRSVRESITGRGAKILLVDDPLKDFIEAHSTTVRDSVWNWWLSVAQTRLQPPSLVVVTATRWHEDDLIGRALSEEYPGDPDEWEVVRLPALAEDDDVLGRAPGEPMISPLVDESPSQALERWDSVRKAVGDYTWSAMYQQRPAPSEGAIFNAEWWKYWTTDPAAVTEDGKVVLLPDDWVHARFVDSWDLTFSKGQDGDFVVGQRWARLGARRFLLAQQRGKWEFTEQLEQMRQWARDDDDALSPYGHLVYSRLIEKAANGAAMISVLEKELSGVKPVIPRGSKEVRARAITPEVESGHVFLPHPSMPGFEWVNEFLTEFRDFPNAKHDDQVDAASQALAELRDSKGTSSVHTPQGRVVRGYEWAGGVPTQGRGSRTSQRGSVSGIGGRQYGFGR